MNTGAFLNYWGHVPGLLPKVYANAFSYFLPLLLLVIFTSSSPSTLRPFIPSSSALFSSTFSSSIYFFLHPILPTRILPAVSPPPLLPQFLPFLSISSHFPSSFNSSSASSSPRPVLPPLAYLLLIQTLTHNRLVCLHGSFRPSITEVDEYRSHRRSPSSSETNLGRGDASKLDRALSLGICLFRLFVCLADCLRPSLSLRVGLYVSVILSLFLSVFSCLSTSLLLFAC